MEETTKEEIEKLMKSKAKQGELSLKLTLNTS